jgi:hypothetical protein
MAIRNDLTIPEVKQVRQAILYYINQYETNVENPANKIILPDAIYTPSSIYTSLIGSVATDKDLAAYFLSQLPEHKRRIVSGLTTKIGHPLVLARSTCFGFKRFEDMRAYALPEFPEIAPKLEPKLVA